MALMVRDVQQGDLNFIRDSFVKSARKIAMTTGFEHQQLRNLLDKAILFHWNCTVLCEQTEPDEILAWQISEPGHRRLFYLLRNAKYRAIKGLGMKLLEFTVKPGPLYCTFIQPSYSMYFLEHGYDPKLRPYIAAEIMGYE